VGGVTAQQGDPRHHGPPSPTWTHVALRVGDIDASIAWYERFTPLRLLDKRQDDFGFGAWLGQPESVERPFILVLAQFFPETDPYKEYPREVLAPFAHLGIELPTRESLDEAARDAEAAGCLALAPQQMPPPVGYVCMLRDPDGNMIELSFDQGVYATARALWGSAAGSPT
jgi:lactoylglutathione lyase